MHLNSAVFRLSAWIGFAVKSRFAPWIESKAFMNWHIRVVVVENLCRVMCRSWRRGVSRSARIDRVWILFFGGRFMNLPYMAEYRVVPLYRWCAGIGFCGRFVNLPYNCFCKLRHSNFYPNQAIDWNVSVKIYVELCVGVSVGAFHEAPESTEC